MSRISSRAPPYPHQRVILWPVVSQGKRDWSSHRSSWLPGVICAAALVLAACERGRYAEDVYQEGLDLEAEAGRGACRLAFDERERAHILNSEKLSICLGTLRAAQAKYEEAKSMGKGGGEMEERMAANAEQIKRLEMMYRTVRQIELDRDVDKFATGG